MRLSIYILVLVIATSCNRAVHKNKTVDVLKKDSTVSFIDTTKTSATKQETTTTYYGDTLTGSLYLPALDTFNVNEYYANNSVYIDSLESNAIKIRVGIMPIKGGFKAHINAISKPKETVKTTLNTALEQKGIAQNTNTNTNQNHSSNSKNSKTVNELYKWVGLTLTGLGLLLLLAFAIYLYIKNKKNGF